MASKKADASAVELPPPPPHLTGDSQTLWRSVVALMAVHKTYTRGSRVVVPSPGRLAVLTTALEARDRAIEARELIGTTLTTTSTTTGVVHAHPLLKVEKDSQALFLRCWQSLGLQWDSELDGGNGC